MFVVLAGRDDGAARRLVEGWPGEAGLLTCRDLCRRGWCHAPGRSGGTAVIDGRTVPAEAIEGVLVRLPCAFEWELGVIAAADRGYVASEMTAFLSAWLSELPCPVFNRPSPIHLMGPSWSDEGWRHAAARLGIRTARSGVEGTLTVTVVTGRVVSEATDDATREVAVALARDADEAARDATVALAREAGVSTLRARFASDPQGPLFAGADYWVDVDDPAVVSAVVAGVRGGAS